MIKELYFKTAKDLFEHIAPWNRSIGFDCYIFRGQSSSDWKLIPTSLRSGNLKRLKFYLHGHFDPPGVGTHPLDIVEIEYQLLREFYKKADQKGLSVPDAPGIRNNIFLKFDNFSFRDSELSKDWLPKQLYETAALAQHYGVPTRLLDWSYSPYIALYFALEGSLTRETLSGDISLWALDKDYLNSILYGAGIFDAVKFITPQYEKNPNLNAQKGLFTYIVNKRDENIFDLCLTEQLNRILGHDIRLEKSIFFKHSMPAKEAAEAIIYLENLGVSASSIYPGYYGVAKEVMEKTLIREKLFNR